MAQQVQLTATVAESQLGQRLDQALAELFPDYSRSRIKDWILDDRVQVNGKTINKPKEKVLGGETVAIDAQIEEEARWEPQDIALNIVYEDSDILVINKPRDLVVHPGAGNPDGTVLNALLHYYPEIADVPRAGIVHRLDKDTTGLMVVAKTVPAQTRLVEALQAREITREYEAVAIGTMTAGGTVEEPISRHSTKRTHMAVHPMGKPCVYVAHQPPAGGRSAVRWSPTSAKRGFGGIHCHIARFRSPGTARHHAALISSNQRYPDGVACAAAAGYGRSD